VRAESLRLARQVMTCLEPNTTTKPGSVARSYAGVQQPLGLPWNKNPKWRRLERFESDGPQATAG